MVRVAQRVSRREDGILMECDEAQLRSVLHQMVDKLINPYAGKKKG